MTKMKNQKRELYDLAIVFGQIFKRFFAKIQRASSTKWLENLRHHSLIVS
jgi:hypothetical protein